ncbi:MAG: phenylacetate-CoA oxygenase [Methylibium sp. NZG]|nr:MAG: phenylacetate-CoA oxygenase [Methylibium sp. NZG]
MVSELLAPPLTREAAWAVLDGVLDPEVPVLSVVELGIVRDVRLDGNQADVIVTPTYSGCPATEAIRDAIVEALLAAGAERVNVRMQLAPAWTTDWIAPAAAEKLRRYGIAPPHLAGAPLGVQPLRFHPRDVPCPRCDSTRTEQLSAFGSTACKALYRCLACREPFDYFKPI